MNAAPSLDRTSVVVIGAWNPAIIQPDWLFRSKVVEVGSSEVTVEVNPRTRQYRYSLGDFRWTVDDNRLEILSQRFEDCGVFAARVLALLPHTPVDAVGTNFVFKYPIQIWPKNLTASIGGFTLDHQPENVKFEQFTWSGVKNLHRGRLQIAVTQKAESDVIVACNIHRNADSAAVASEFAGLWSQDHETVRESLRLAFDLPSE
jgi:hypothetical protein